MNIKGKVIAELPVTSGTSSKGTDWTKGGFVIETDEQYPKKVSFETFNKPAVLEAAQPGAVIDVSFDVTSQEYQGKWYTKAQAYKVEVITPAATIDYGAPVQPPF
jgi:preprotein translocase subunit SecB